MSRIGNSPIKLPPKVEVTLGKGEISVKGPLGSLSQRFGEASRSSKRRYAHAQGRQRRVNALHGTVRALVANMVKGVTVRLRKRSALVGVGYRAQAAGDKLICRWALASRRAQDAESRQGRDAVPTEIIIKGVDKQQVGQVAAEIRAYRPPEPYKGKGVRYANEQVTLKETKKK